MRRWAARTAVAVLVALAWLCGDWPAYCQEVEALAAALGERGILYNTQALHLHCDGKTDVAPALGVIIARAANARSPGDPRPVVAIPPSSSACMLGEPLTLPSNVVLLAAPGTVTLKPLNSMTGNVLIIRLRGVSGVLIYGIGIDGALRGDHPVESAARAVLAYEVHDIVFDHISVRHTRGIGIEFSTDTANTTIKNSEFYDIGNFWESTGQRSDRAQAINWDCGPPHSNVVVENNEFRGIGLDPIATCSAYGVRVANNKLMIDSDQFGRLRSPDYPGAIYFIRSSHGVIEGNTIVGAAGACIDVAQSSALVIKNNRGVRCGAAGVSVADASDIQIIGNKLEANGQTTVRGLAHMIQTGGISLLGPATNIVIDRNEISDFQAQRTQEWGIQALTRDGPLTGIVIGQSNVLIGNAKGTLSTNIRCSRGTGLEPTCSASPSVP